MSLEKNTLEFLKAVMSSHATFNALSAIQNYIVSDEKRDALLSLSSFAKFIRRMSNSAVCEAVSVNEEIDFVHSYMEMEVLRFGDEIVFEKDIDADLENCTDLIPSFIIQPYIEKMLMKGLKTGARDFTLMLEIKKKRDILAVCIKIDKEIDTAIESNFTEEQKNRSTLLKERVSLYSKDIIEITYNEGGFHITAIQLLIN